MAVPPPDAHIKPPVEIREVYKQYQKCQIKHLEQDPDLIDTAALSSGNHSSRIIQVPDLLPLKPSIPVNGSLEVSQSCLDMAMARDQMVYELLELPGLYLYPGLFDALTQRHLLDVLLHRDLSNHAHQTNVHMHYSIQYPPLQAEPNATTSFFDKSASDLTFQPIDPDVHKPFPLNQFLNKKLRWMTIGGQYDWTRKVYPDAKPPDFPHECKTLIESLFPLKAEAAIVNLYSPGDTLSLHRDVSEQCDCPLASISIGCDALFTVGLSTETGIKVATIRLRSGDALLMSGPSRYAWHGVPKVLAGTCPEVLRDWPCHESNLADGGRYEAWRGWLSNKRINLNVRQMFA